MLQRSSFIFLWIILLGAFWASSAFQLSDPIQLSNSTSKADPVSIETPTVVQLKNEKIPLRARKDQDTIDLAVNNSAGKENKRVQPISLNSANLNQDHCVSINGDENGSSKIVGIEGGITPKGLFLNQATGELCGTPTEIGIFKFNLVTADSNGVLKSSVHKLVVADGSQSDSNEPLQILTKQLAVAQIGAEYVFKLENRGGRTPLQWSITGLPEGLESDASSGIIAGRAAEDGEFSIEVNVKDKQGQSDSIELPLTVRVTPIFITTGALDEGVVKEPYQNRLGAQGGVPPYRWTIVAGALPAGMQLNPTTGVIDGVPSAEFDGVLRIRAIDQAKKSDDVELPLKIRSSSLAITTQAVGDGFQNTPYAFNMAAQGGTPPYSWKLESGQIPGALVLDSRGVLSGLPQISGQFVITLTVEDQKGQIASRRLNLRIQEKALTEEASEQTPVDEKSPAEQTTQVDPVSIEKPTATEPTPYADRVVAFNPIDKNCYNCNRVSEVLLGPPSGGGEGKGSTDVVSLGARVNSDNGVSAPYGGSITLEFTDNVVKNGPGVDFTIFENAFRLPGTDNYFVEPAVVEVSADGVHFFRFPFDFVPHYKEDGSLNLYNPLCYFKGFAGVHPVYSNAGSPSPLNPVLSGGDSFDLSDIPGANFSSIRFIRITSTGDGWLMDSQGDLVRHANSAPTWAASGKGNSGFDLDSVVAINFE